MPARQTALLPLPCGEGTRRTTFVALVGQVVRLLIDLAAMPILAYGYYLQFSALARHLEIADES